MKRRSVKSSTISVDMDDEEQCGSVNHTNGEVKLGHLLWVKDQGLWWPGQVVDANTVSDNMKPDNRSIGEVLVRLYGSYDYLYVDPAKYRVDFQTILKNNNGSYREILEKSLKQELPDYKPARSKGRGSQAIGHDELDKNQESKSQKSGSDLLDNEHAPVSSSRRTKAQKAGLTDVSTNINLSDKQGRKLRSVTKNNKTDNGTSIASAPHSTMKNGSSCSEETQNASHKSSRQSKRKLEATDPESVKKSNSGLSETNVLESETKVDMSTEKTMNNRIADTWELKVNCNDGMETSKKTPEQDWVQKEVMLIVSSVMEEEKLENSGHDGLEENIEPDSPRTKDGKDVPQS